jgi:hypothetical protein
VAKQSVTVGMSGFVFEALGGEDGEDAARVPVIVVRAVRFYLRDRDSGRPGWQYPDFLRGSEVREDLTLELNADEGLWRALAEEAERQRVSIQQMIQHAALYFAAEISAGRATERILEDLEGDDYANDA